MECLAAIYRPLSGYSYPDCVKLPEGPCQAPRASEFNLLVSKCFHLPVSSLQLTFLTMLCHSIPRVGVAGSWCLRID
jgi:hypothetical protein